ncbi:MAG TPA: MFS transporter [Bacteroidales bacterium]|nr:MFS transporter [Bacteroidales bacterium]HPJ54965.1 MFS transporter [Bacteroidales bacterium]HPQ56176.1 MFS transporter [Bacteroidales bacterium]
MTKQSKMTFWDIWNMTFGFLGIQFGLALQNANVSRILQSFGADVDHLSLFWIAAPLTGMIVQPIIGHYSDQTWTRLGRRRPFFLAGAVMASLALVMMPNAPMLAPYISPMFIGAGILMIMDASINVAMEPFRALVADLLPSDQRTLGFSVQTSLIGVGAVLGAILPYLLTNWFGISNVPEPESGDLVAHNVTYAFYIGAAVLMGSVLWTVIKTKEYPPEDGNHPEKMPFWQIGKDFLKIPKTMKQLGVVQFFSWFALFSMWVYMVPAVAEHVYGSTDNASQAYADAGDWVGILQGVYNGVAAVFAFLLPWIAKKIGRKGTHALCLFLGAIGFLSFFIIKDPALLIFPMIGVGIAWAGILAMPYSILAGALPAHKMGVYMGIFNFFITIPQICNGLIGGIMVKHIYGGHTIFALVFSGICLLIAAVSVFFVDDKDDPVQLSFRYKQRIRLST